MDLIIKLKPEKFPKPLTEIPQPPKELYIRGTLPPSDYTYLTIVGSRKYTSYGKEVCEKLIKGLKDYPIVIVSGLALGIDSIVHRSALSNGLITIAMPGSGVDNKVIYPRTNINLAEDIIRNGGCIMSEFPPTMKAEIYTFPKRNRLMAGISKATLIIEAVEKSGTLITARMALDYNRDVLAVPGSIFSNSSSGTNRLIRQGATPITNSNELLEALGFEVNNETSESVDKYKECGKDELKIISLLNEPMERNELIRASGMEISEASALLSIMEIKELIKEELGEIRRV